MPSSAPVRRAPLAALLAGLALGLPALLMWTSWSSFQTQQEQKRVYLQSLIGALVARLETLPQPEDPEQLEMLAAEEPALAGVVILKERKPGDGLDELWEGRRLFLLEQREEAQVRIVRGFVPFHANGQLCIARIDLWADAADFIVRPARRNLTASAAASLALFVLSVLMWREIQARQRALLRQAELEHLARLGRLAAVMAHEIRNPLGTIKGFAQLLEEQLPDSQKALAAPIITESARLERLVNDLLAYGRPRQPAIVSIPLRSLLDGLVESFRRAAGSVEIAWTPESVPEDFPIETDPDLLKQILLNLLRNAAEAASGSSRPQVMLRVSTGPAEARFEVRDNGPGFSPEAMQRAFEPFFTTKASGSGLGLAISRRLAGALGGTLELNNAPEGGATALLRLPVRARTDRPDHSLHS